MTYQYLGDRNTDGSLKKSHCIAVKRKDGKCIRGKNGSMLVEFENGSRHVVVGRLLRKVMIEPKGYKDIPHKATAGKHRAL